MNVRAIYPGLAAVVMILGCDQPPSVETYAVKGKVQLQGSPLTAGSISFATAGHAIGHVAISPAGTYEIQLPAGEYAVCVSMPDEMPPGLSPMEEFAYVPKRQTIPTRYADMQTSPLTIEVEPTAENIRDLLLTR